MGGLAILNKTSEELAKHKEMFAAAYLKITDLDPRDAVLVQRLVRNGCYEFYFRKKTKEDIKKDEPRN